MFKATKNGRGAADRLRKFLSMVKGYFVREPGAAFIIVFDALIFSCAFSLVRGDEALASEIAVYGYLFLVVGVVLQALSAVKSEASRGEVG